MSSIEAEKNALLSKAESTIKSVQSSVVNVADSVGLGEEANQMMEEIN